MRRRLYGAIDSFPGGVVLVDLSDVTFMDSVALGVLVAGYKRARDKNGSMRIVNIPTQVDAVLDTTGMAKVLAPEDEG